MSSTKWNSAFSTSACLPFCCRLDFGLRVTGVSSLRILLIVESATRTPNSLRSHRQRSACVSSGFSRWCVYRAFFWTKERCVRGAIRTSCLSADVFGNCELSLRGENGMGGGRHYVLLSNSCAIEKIHLKCVCVFFSKMRFYNCVGPFNRGPSICELSVVT